MRVLDARFLWLLLSVVCAAPVRADDAWLGADKGLHMSVSAALGASGYAAGMLAWHEPWQRAVFGAGLSLSFGVGKELYDAMGYGDPSLRDLTWDLIGCALGVGVALLIDYASRGPPAQRRLSAHGLRVARW